MKNLIFAPLLLIVSCKPLEQVKSLLNFQKSDQQVLTDTSIPMPKLPELNSDTKSTQGFMRDPVWDEQKAEFLSLPVEKRQNYHLAFIDEIYVLLIGRLPSDNERTEILNRLLQGGDREGVLFGLAAGEEFRRRMQTSELVSQKLLAFFQDYMLHFIGLEYDADQLASLNPHKLKALMLEKSLEMLEAFEEGPKDLYAWYAHVSAYLAKRAQGGFEAKLRDSTELNTHLQWAKAVPLDHIKSELVIKLLKVAQIES